MQVPQAEFVPDDFAPVFIVGCGRSGTSLLGALVGRHAAVEYLNEARVIWINGFPEADVWTIQGTSLSLSCRSIVLDV